MKKLVLATLILGVALVGLQAQASANMLSDPGFDIMGVQEITWSTTPWWGGGGGGSSSGGGAWVTAAESQSAPHSATLFLYGSDWAYAMAAQTLTGGITPGTTYVTSASFLRQAGITPAEAFFKIEWLNAGGGTIRADEGTVRFDNSYSAGIWHTLSDQFTAPADTVGAKYELIYVKEAGADPADIWIDDTSFEVVPEPASLLLLGSGLVGLFGVTRRRRG